QLGDPALRIIDVAEDDGVRRARLLAGRADLAVANAALLLFGLDLRGVDALHAVRALLHDAAAPYRHVRIAAALQAFARPVGEEVPVEAANLVRTVVRAVPRADAAVVHHVVQAFGAVVGRTDRAHHFAGGVFALHASERLKVRLRILDVALVVTVDTDPMHLAAAAHLIFADDGDVVLRLTGDHAGVAADAGREIDRHTPRVAVVIPRRLVERVVGARGFAEPPGELGILAELRE